MNEPGQSEERQALLKVVKGSKLLAETVAGLVQIIREHSARIAELERLVKELEAKKLS